MFDAFHPIVFVVLFVIFVLSCLSRRFSRESFVEHAMILPKRIWTFWDNIGTMPVLVKDCVSSWSRYTDAEITLVTIDTLKNYVQDIPENFEQLMPQLKADWIRCALLKKYGGVWMDASMILTAPLSDWLFVPEKKELEYVGFYIDASSKPESKAKGFPIVENWFMSCPAPEHRMTPSYVDKLFEEFDYRIRKFGNECRGYLDELDQKYPSHDLVQNMIEPCYLSMHVATQVVLQHVQKSIGKRWALKLWQADAGPFLIHFHNKWNLEKVVHDIFVHDYDSLPYALPNMIKIRNVERIEIEKFLSSPGRKISENSIYSRFVKPDGFR